MLQDKINDITDIKPDPMQEENPSEEYQFADGYIDPDDSLEEFLDDFRRPKEETGAADQPDENEFEEENGDEDLIGTDAAKYTADFIVTVTDEILAQSLAYISKNPAEQYRAGKEQRKHLKKLWKNYCQEKQIELPPGTQLIIGMGAVYGPMFITAFSDRKTNLKLERLKEDQHRLSYDREMLKRERESFERQKKQAMDHDK